MLSDAYISQIHQLRRGRVPIRLRRACTLGDGVVSLDSLDGPRLESAYRSAMLAGRVTKFVPASGAATRMFSEIASALAETLTRDSLSEPTQAVIARLAAGINDFAFAAPLRDALGLESGADLRAPLSREPVKVLQGLLGEGGLNLASMPKGLVPFHQYPGGVRCALDEHFEEALELATDASGKSRLHFTVAAAHQDDFWAAFDRAKMSRARPGVHFEVGLSIQDPATDTVAIDRHGEVILGPTGEPLTRPAGHGALLTNLANLDADLIYLKNIDNVVPDRARPAANRHKAIMGGLLVRLQAQMFDYLRSLEAGLPGSAELHGMLDFASRELNAAEADDLRSSPPAAIRSYLQDRFDRPLRVCGVVPTAGEPGGGPFWTAAEKYPLQIVESISVDLDDDEQRQIWQSSTHFNPVDLMCAVRNHRDEAYALTDFVDEDAAMIGDKSYQGAPIKVLERPGLWNGAMARWNTVFLEVPAESFNPVKTVFDLLRPAHRAAPTGGC